MTQSKAPCLIPVRVMACVFDPQTLSRTKEVVKENGAVRESPHAWAWHPPNYEKLDAKRTEAFDRVWPRLFESIDPPGMENRGGVCLTIAPPPGFSKPQDDEARILPHLPDRWLWVRIVRRIHDASGQWIDEMPTVRTWIVDTGIRTDEAESAPILTKVDEELVALRMGMRRSLEEAQRLGPDEPRIPLHVQGTDQSTSMTFAAYAPAHNNNLSLIDTLDDIAPEDLQDSAVSYFVVGWYRDPTRDDPLVQHKAAGKADDDIRRALELFDETAGEPRPLGERSIFHGSVTHIDYWNGRSYLGPAFGTPGAGPVHPCVGTFHHEPQKIGFGATSEEALAALLADISPEDESGQKLSVDFFRLLKALLHDRLDAWDVIGSEDVLRHAEQGTTFSAVDGGAEWTIGAAEDTDLSGKERETLEITGEQQSMLGALNALQSQADAARREFASASETLYTAWWQALRARGRRKVALEQATNRHAEITQSYRTEMERLQPAIEVARNALQAALDTTLGRGIAEVKSFPKHTFFVPKEPAIAIRNIGPRIPPTPERTIARTLDDVATDQAPDTYTRLQRAPIRAALRVYTDADLDAVFDALAEEASLVEAAIASLMRDDGPRAIFDQYSHVVQWEERNRRVRMKAARVEFLTTNGQRVALSNVGTFWDQQPWIPIFLDWEVEWFPAGETTDSSGGALLSGRTVLASRPQTLIRSRLERLEKTTTKVATALATCRHLLEDVMEWDVLAQSLSGLHQQLLARDDGLPRVLPPDEPLRSLVEHTSLAPPNLASNLEFSTVRRGDLRINRLWVVDMFGQALRLDPTIKTAAETAGNPLLRRLELRLLEPSRLAVDFDVLPGAKNPLRAWILPSLADKALIVYDGQGKPLGMISRLADSVELPGTSWRPVLANAPKTLDELADPVLAAFLRPLVGGPDALQRFEATMQHIDQALARTLPPQSNASMSPASMLGRPLVLVQARVRIERRGGPIADPAEVLAPSPNTSADSSLKVPIWIGSRSLPDDGVIGFHSGNALQVMERTAKLVSGPPDGPPSFMLDAPGAADSIPITLLMDPHGKIYLESNILPVTTLRLASKWVDDVAQRLPAVLRVMPALIHSHALLRSLFAPNESESPASIDLPLPLGASSSGQTAAQALLSTGRGIDIPIKPLSTTAIVPETGVAAIEGILIL